MDKDSVINELKKESFIKKTLAFFPKMYYNILNKQADN